MPRNYRTETRYSTYNVAGGPKALVIEDRGSTFIPGLGWDKVMIGKPLIAKRTTARKQRAKAKSAVDFVASAANMSRASALQVLEIATSTGAKNIKIQL